MPNAGPGTLCIRILTGVSALLMLAVVAASAYIRASGGIDVQFVRGAHRLAASSVALLVFALLALAWGQPRLRVPASVAFVLMLALSAVGWITGTTPPPAAAFFNQSGGFVLTALLAWICGRAAAPFDPEPERKPALVARDRKLALAALVLASLQATFGGTLAIFAPHASVGILILHAAAGLAAAAAVAALGWRYTACAALAPALGVVSVLLPASAAQAGHALAGALLLAAAAYAHALALVYTRATPPSRPLNA